MRADRYVDAGREFGRLLDDLVAARRPGAERRCDRPTGIAGTYDLAAPSA